MNGVNMLFFTVGKIQRQLKEIYSGVHREKRGIAHFKYAEGDPAGAAAPDFDDRARPRKSTG
ncbi:MAG TPA: hypothetical protein VFO91_03475 [Anaerolineales bacterium]|nr:hypothetical protein [Anaerolineales bacterium]